jgi:hypothetical protein
VFVSKYGKTYDSADGSEQVDVRGGPPARPGAQRGGQIGRERWEDDGGPANDRPAPLSAGAPAWSVLSLRDLNEHVRREHGADDPERLRADAERDGRRAVQLRQLAADTEDTAARARVDRYRNAWENT